MFSKVIHSPMCLVAQSCPTFCYPRDCSPPGSSVHGFLQARTVEWVAIAFSRGSSRPTNRTQVSCIEGRSPALPVDSLPTELQGKSPHRLEYSLIFEISESRGTSVMLCASVFTAAAAKSLWSCPTLCDRTFCRTVAHQAPLSMGFSRRKYWSGLPSLPPRDLFFFSFFF